MLMPASALHTSMARRAWSHLCIVTPRLLAFAGQPLAETTARLARLLGEPLALYRLACRSHRQ